MKRVWKTAAIVPQDGGWGIALDGRPVRTPARAPLVVPSEELAEAIAAEWNAQGSDIDPAAIAVTQENAAANDVADIRLVVADGALSEEIADGAPYDLVIANILAGPLISMAPEVAAIAAPGATPWSATRSRSA